MTKHDFVDANTSISESTAGRAEAPAHAHAPAAERRPISTPRPSFTRAAQALLGVVALATLLGTALTARVVGADEGEAAAQARTPTLEFDVAENATRFIFDETPLDADGLPGYANEFITEGYIYEAGTLNEANGVNPDGSPEFPDKVIGRWTCRGWHVGDGAKTATGPWVITQQLYDFGDTPGSQMLTTDGVELVDLNVPVQRAIIGGTGQFMKARGEATQTMIGFNQLKGVNLRFALKVTK